MEAAGYRQTSREVVEFVFMTALFSPFSKSRKRESCPWIDLTQPSTVSFCLRLRVQHLLKDGSPMRDL